MLKNPIFRMVDDWTSGGYSFTDPPFRWGLAAGEAAALLNELTFDEVRWRAGELGNRGVPNKWNPHKKRAKNPVQMGSFCLGIKVVKSAVIYK